ncbi:MAG: cardiolipin synthase [Lachnospiraceae bacterium]|nr:cardiolipin synthase [Lachnospiraceae bacterium]
MIFVSLSVILETALLVHLAFNISDSISWVNLITRIVAVVLVLGIYSQYKTSSLKMPWIILILVLPVMGVTLFLLVGLTVRTGKMYNRFRETDAEILPMLEGKKKPETDDRSVDNLSFYISTRSGFPAYADANVRYFSDTNEALSAQIEAMKAAKKFIFLEYHAIEDSVAWQRVEEVLAEKVAQGVEVRVFYDDLGSLVFINNTDFIKKMKSLGIHARVFNPFIIGANLFLNNRDHRKITIVDGNIGFTGGYNLADEYFNITHPYGLWKDTGIQIYGEPVRNMTAMFLEMWNAIRSTDEDDADYTGYLDAASVPPAEEKGERVSIVQPYADTPLDNEQVGEEVYISMVNLAERYCYFVTPYLIISDEMSHALSLAAKRGVDVRIVTPGIPDKKFVYGVTRSFYHHLARNGVGIYEWTPGFVHAKMCVTDDKAATVGTINLDYRSLYHHFENGCFLYGGELITGIRKDFEQMIAESQYVTPKYTSGRKFYLRFGQLLMRLFAQLL